MEALEILKGYQFEKGDIFSGYVNKMYNLRLQYSKGHAMNLIAKLLLNSLYGKFGMRQEITRVDIFDTTNEESSNTLRSLMSVAGETIHDFIKIDHKNVIVVRDTIVSLQYDHEHDFYHGLDVNIAIASAITAGARVYMSFFKINPKYSLYYSDTDSVVIDQTLPTELVGEGLGLLKLENTIRKAVFLAPKVYGLISEEGVEIIKVKGVTPEAASTIHISDLEQLLIKDSTKDNSQVNGIKK